MTEFTGKLPVWYAQGIEPPISKVEAGWKIDERPPADYMNYLQNTTYEAIRDLQDNAAHKDDIGNLSDLQTTTKDNLVKAINEAEEKAEVASNQIGNLLNTEINNALIPKRERRPIVTFIDDDGRKEVLLKWRNVLSEKGIQMTIPLVTSAIDNDDRYMTWQEVAEMSKLGVEFCSHTHTHARLSDITEAQIAKEYEDSKKIIREQGYNDRLIVYPYGADNELVRKKTREYFEVGVDVDEGINYPPLSTFQLKRITLAEATNNTLDYYKSKIDEAIANKGWLIFKSHSQYESFDVAQIQIIKDLIDYIRLKNVEIVNLSRGLKIFGNIMDIGDYPARAMGAEYTIMDCEGIMYSKTNSKQYAVTPDTNTLFTTPLTSFPEKSTTTSVVVSANAAQFPEGKAGILNTFRFTTGDFCYQIYSIYNSNNVYRRIWDKTNSVWLAFEKISYSGTDKIIIDTGVDTYTTANVPTDFAANKISYTRISSANTDIANFPSKLSGTLITNRLYTSGANYVYQEYHAYDGNMYRRAYINTAWGVWEQITTGTGKEVLKIQLPVATIPANSVLDVKLVYANAKTGDLISGNPLVGLEAGLVYNTFVSTVGNITIRFHNVTGADITTVARNWRFLRIP